MTNVELRRKQKREQSEQMTQQYIALYIDAMNALRDIRKAIENGDPSPQVLAIVNEAFIVDDAMWHLHDANRKNLAAEHAAQRKKTRARKTARPGGAP